MLNFENPSLENFSLSAYGMIAVPLNVHTDADGQDLTITSYKIAEKISQEFIDKFSEEPYSAEAVEFLRLKLSQLMDSYFYKASEDNLEIILEFSSSKADVKASDEVALFKTADEINLFEEKKTWSLEINDDDEADVIFGVVKDGHLVSYATINDFRENNDIEITTYTDEEYRNHGYGTSCVSALTGYLLENCGFERVLYKCREDNTASVKTALAAGYSLIGKSLPSVFYRSEAIDTANSER